MTPKQRNNLIFHFNLLLYADYDSPIIAVDEEKSVCKKFVRMGLLEEHKLAPGTYEYRRTEKGDNFLFSIFKEKKKRVK